MDATCSTFHGDKTSSITVKPVKVFCPLTFPLCAVQSHIYTLTTDLFLDNVNSPNTCKYNRSSDSCWCHLMPSAWTWWWCPARLHSGWIPCHSRRSRDLRCAPKCRNGWWTLTLCVCVCDYSNNIILYYVAGKFRMHGENFIPLFRPSPSLN